MIPRSWRFVALLVGLLAVNLVISFVTSGPEDRQRVPYQPFFVDQVEAGNVNEISSQEDSIEGELNRGDLRPTRRRRAGDGHELRDRGPRVHRSPPSSPSCSTARRTS